MDEAAEGAGAVPVPPPVPQPVPQVHTPPVGSRVVVRYLLPTGQATDALGMLRSADDAELVVDGKRGIERIAGNVSDLCRRRRCRGPVSARGTVERGHERIHRK